MEIKLAENLRTLRKQKGLTQEQLAETLNVSIGVISKWELGLSMPEIGLIMELADFFQTSVDVLLGFQKQNRSREQVLERLKELTHDRCRELPYVEVEKQVSRFPNDFAIIHRVARLYSSRGTMAQDQKLLLRALELTQRACLLLDQNTDPEISWLSLQNDIAALLCTLERSEDALALYQKNNPQGINDHLIGGLLAGSLERPRDAIPYLSSALMRSIFKQMAIAMGYMNVYMKLGRFPEALEIIGWTEGLCELCRLPGKISPLDKLASCHSAIAAFVHIQQRDLAQAKASLKEAKTLAQRFDAAPCYAAGSLRFVEMPLATVYDDFGDTAMEGIGQYIREENHPVLTALWTEVCHEE